MKQICIILARGGSKGVPCKNIRPILGKPLIAYSIEKAITSKIFSHVIVSTEDHEIATISKKFGAEVPFLRPKKLATSRAGAIDAIIHAIKKLQSLRYDFDIIANLDCTCPFIRKKDIAGSVKLLRKTNSNAVFAVYRQHLNPYFNMAELNSQNFLEVSKSIGERPKRRQDAPIVYQINGLHVFKVKELVKYKKLFIPKILAYEIPMETGIMIDTEFEFKIADYIIRNKIIKT